MTLLPLLSLVVLLHSFSPPVGCGGAGEYSSLPIATFRISLYHHHSASSPPLRFTLFKFISSSNSWWLLSTPRALSFLTHLVLCVVPSLPFFFSSSTPHFFPRLSPLQWLYTPPPLPSQNSWWIISALHLTLEFCAKPQSWITPANTSPSLLFTCCWTDWRNS